MGQPYNGILLKRYDLTTHDSSSHLKCILLSQRGNLKWLHTIQLQLYDILEKAVKRHQKDEWFARG
jgi:hypothetical protein